MKARYAFIGLLLLGCICAALLPRALMSRGVVAQASTVGLSMSVTEFDLAAKVWSIGIRQDESQLDTVLGALKSPHPSVRRSAAIALGRIGSQRALNALADAQHLIPDYTDDPVWRDKMRKTCEQLHKRDVVPAARIAVARIRSLSAKGADRIGAFESALGSTRADTISAARERQAGAPRRIWTSDAPVQDDPLYVNTISEMLAEERSRGHDVSAVTQQVPFDHARRMRVDGAGKPQVQRIRAMVDWLASRSVSSDEEMEVAKVLIDEGPAAAPEIVTRLRTDLAKSPRLNGGQKELVRTLAAVGDRSDIPFLESIASNPDARRYAKYAIGYLSAARINPFPFGPE